MKTRNTETIQMSPVQSMDELSQQELREAAEVYKRAFADPPYEEAFADDEAIEAMRYILDRQGNLVFGRADDRVVALAGGYMKPEGGVYYIEELAVDPDKQGRGIGRQTLRILLDEALGQSPNTLEIRTTIRNDRALALYGSEGFTGEPTTEVVAQTRQDGMIALDERVYLSKSIKEKDMEKAESLRRAVIAYPSGNTTAIVYDQLLDADREALNAQIMNSWQSQETGQPEIEQCCFVTMPKDSRAMARVEMFGGEFCGNATRSVIRSITGGKDYQGLIEVSGVERPLNYNVRDEVVTVEMPLPRDRKLTEEVSEGVLVQLDGISQLVVSGAEKQGGQTPREMLVRLLEQNKYDLAEQPAVGVTYYDEAAKKADFGVWVKEVNTIFDETACGSGTCAIGVALALAKKQDQKLEVIQPSGESIMTEAMFSNETGEVVASRISGKVEILYDGEFELS